MYFSHNEKFFEECPELMNEINSGNIVFYNRAQTKALWSVFVSSEESHLMLMDLKILFSKIEHYDVDFEKKESADKVFSIFNELSGFPKLVLFFFSNQDACVTPFELLENYWYEYFLPSDENAIVITEKNSHCLFSFEERFFIATR